MITQSFYHIRPKRNKAHYLSIEWTFVALETGLIFLQLPIWRPGRYQAQHFAKNIPSVYQLIEGEQEAVAKVSGSCWQVQAKAGERIHLCWDYYALQEDAGGSVVQEEFLYINFINCCLFVKGCEDLDVEVQLAFPDHWHYLTSLGLKEGHSFLAKSYRELVDSPFMAAPVLQVAAWEEKGVQFKAGGFDPLFAINQKVIQSYQKFTAFQLNYMGGFPVNSYVYMHWICPKPYYHGVEHTKSTMIVLGAPERDLYEDLIGVASHELFHVWNICTIRPKELLPYAYEKEVIFPSGGVVEGITTYLGDWFLFASEVWTADEYVAGLQGNLKLHFERERDHAQSLVDSSVDLWLDGYGQALPGKRVSIYYKGALMALGLDVLIRQKFGHQKSIREVMLLMNERFGQLKQGYTLQGFYQLCSEVYESDLSNWFARWMESSTDLFEELNTLLAYIGLELQMSDSELHLKKFDEERFLMYRKA
jgi:predicted metalloprotease with PDZ domain